MGKFYKFYDYEKYYLIYFMTKKKFYLINL